MASSSRSAPAPETGSTKHVLALFGPTASGKSEVARLLRERLGFDVISADSAAVYRGLPVVTAAPDYPAQLVAFAALDEEVSVGAYQRLAHAAIDSASKPLVVGGTGLYLRAALSSLELPPAPAPERRAFWREEVARLGPAAAHGLLATRDPAAAARVHANDTKRLVRALELNETGHSLAPRRDALWTEDTRLPTTIVALELPLETLDLRIEERTRAMLAAGAVDEAKRAWAGPLSTTARQVLGLEEFATLPEEEAVEAVGLATRRLARYQRKWLRRLPGVVRLAADRSPEEVADDIVALGCSGQHLPDRDGIARRA